MSTPPNASSGQSPLDQCRGAFETIKNELILLLEHRAMFRSVREMITRNPRLPEGSVVYEWLTLGYVHVATTSVRRQLDRRRDSISLWRLLGDLAGQASELTRARFVSQYPPEMRSPLPGKDRSVADRDFDEFAPNGGAHASRDLIVGLRDRLEASGDAIKSYIDEHVAHRAAQPSPLPVTYNDLDAAIDGVVDAANRCGRLLVGAGGIMEPTILEPWKEVFRVAWDPDAEGTASGRHHIAFDVVKNRWLLECFAVPQGGGYRWLGFLVDLADPDADLPLEAQRSHPPHPQTGTGWGVSLESAREMGLVWFQITKEQLPESGE